VPHARLSEIHPDWPKVAWIDSDVNFERDDIMDETRHALAHYDVVQMWSHAQDMGPENEPLPDMGRFRFFFPHRASARPRARRRLQETTRSRLAISTWTATRRRPGG
jgi:hypothetical protein